MQDTYVYMQDNYVYMQDIYVNMQVIYAYMQDHYVYMQDIHVYIITKYFYTSQNLCSAMKKLCSDVPSGPPSTCQASYKWLPLKGLIILSLDVFSVVSLNTVRQQPSCGDLKHHELHVTSL